MITQKEWDELKTHVEKQHQRALQLQNNVGRLCAHVWKDVKDKMWSIEQRENK